MQELSCPNCGAPLAAAPTQQQVTCTYCHTTVRLAGPVAVPSGPTAAEPPPAAIPTPDRALRAELDALLLAGERDRAIVRFQEAMGTERAVAEEGVDRLVKRLGRLAVAGLRLSGLGMLIAALAVVSPVGVLWLFLSFLDNHAFLVALVPLVVAASLARKALTTMAYWTARKAPAVVLRAIPITEHETMHVVNVTFEVRPPGRDSFERTCLAAVKPEHLERVRSGASARVRYLGGKSDSVVVDEWMG